MKSLLCIKYKMIYTLKVEMNSSPHPPKEVSTMHTLFIWGLLTIIHHILDRVEL